MSDRAPCPFFNTSNYHDISIIESAVMLAGRLRKADSSRFMSIQLPVEARIVTSVKQWVLCTLIDGRMFLVKHSMIKAPQGNPLFINCTYYLTWARPGGEKKQKEGRHGALSSWNILTPPDRSVMLDYIFSDSLLGEVLFEEIGFHPIVPYNGRDLKVSLVP